MKKQYRSEFNQRQNMTRDNYEIYYYSDTHFQSVSPHKHDYYEFYFPVSGKIEMEIRGKRIRLDNRSTAVIPPATTHRAVTENDERSYCRYVFWISASYFRQLREKMPSLAYIAEQAEAGRYIHHFSDYEYTSIQSKILRLIEEDKADRYGHDAFTDIVICDLLMTLSRLVHEQDHPLNREKDTDTVQAMIEYIDQHLEEDLSLETLGEQFYISKYYAAHEFKERTGISVHQYILKKRLQRCADEIKTGKPVSRICTEYGFQDYSSFYRAFRKEYNVSPKEYQMTYKHDPMYPGRQTETKIR